MYTAEVRKTLYVLDMNQHKVRIKPETKTKMYFNFVEECRKVVEAFDGNHGG